MERISAATSTATSTYLYVTNVFFLDKSFIHIPSKYWVYSVHPTQIDGQTAAEVNVIAQSPMQMCLICYITVKCQKEMYFYSTLPVNSNDVDR